MMSIEEMRKRVSLVEEQYQSGIAQVEHQIRQLQREWQKKTDSMMLEVASEMADFVEGKWILLKNGKWETGNKYAKVRLLHRNHGMNQPMILSCDVLTLDKDYVRYDRNCGKYDCGTPTVAEFLDNPNRYIIDTAALLDKFKNNISSIENVFTQGDNCWDVGIWGSFNLTYAFRSKMEDNNSDVYMLKLATNDKDNSEINYGAIEVSCGSLCEELNGKNTSYSKDKNSTKAFTDFINMIISEICA